MIQYSPYTLTTLASTAVILAMGVCLMALAIPRDAQLRSYCISRRLLGMAYILLAFQSIAGVLWGIKIHADMLTPIFQAFMFTYALTTLLNLRYFTRRRILRQCLVFGVLSLLVIVNTYVLPTPNTLLSYAILVGYFGLFAYYIWVFFSEYRNYPNNKSKISFMKTTRLLITLLVGAVILFSGCNNDDDPATYSVTVTNDGNGTAETDKTTAEAGTTVKLTATAATGYVFEKWAVESGDISLSPDATANPATFTMPAGAVSIKAMFTKTPADTEITDSIDGWDDQDMRNEDAEQQ